MKKRIIWLGLNCLIALSLVLASCAPAPTTTAPPKETAPTKETAAPTTAPPKETALPAEEKPRYGGVITLGLGVADVIGLTYDQVYVRSAWWGLPLPLVYDELLMGDWTMGPAGSGKTTFIDSAFAPDGFLRDTGALAESWQIPDNQTLIFKIRKGVYWQNKPPVNGREFTATDVVFSINRMYRNPDYPTTYNVRVAPAGTRVTNVYVDPDDKWTVVVKVSDMAIVWQEEIGDKLWMYAPEVIAKYGSASDWRNAVGTGAFILTDYVSGSSATMVRNPNYWMKDPIGPGKGNQLPYVDGVIALQIPDTSTRMAALRTGKIDYERDISWEDGLSLKRTNPEINQKKYRASTPPGYTARPSSTDPRAEPFKKKRVRQAMFMAIDKEAIVRDYYGGNAHILQFFWFPDSPYYTPLDKMPAIVQKMYGYYPEEAKKILAEEGYPNGFKTVITLGAKDVDLFSIVKEYWRKNLNVDLELDVKEPGVLLSIRAGRLWPALYSAGRANTAYREKWLPFGPADPNLPRFEGNFGEVNDPVVNDAANRFNAAWNAGDLELRNQIIKEVEPYILEQAWYITFPAADWFVAYQRWLKNNYGVFSVGYRNYYDFGRLAWVDQELKKAMGR